MPGRGFVQRSLAATRSASEPTLAKLSLSISSSAMAISKRS